MVESKKLSTYSWWFDSQNDNDITKRSTWLRSTLAELDEKTESMLKLIEEDADSFAKRAEMYYKKRPQLINIIHDFYQTHRSLALCYDQATKVDSSTRLSAHCLSESFDFDHDQDLGKSESIDQQTQENQVLGDLKNEQVMNLLQEIKRLKDEKNVQKQLMVLKDEEKREAIRQLSVSLDLLKQENSSLKKRIGKGSVKKQINVARVYWEKLFT